MYQLNAIWELWRRPTVISSICSLQHTYLAYFPSHICQPWPSEVSAILLFEGGFIDVFFTCILCCMFCGQNNIMFVRKIEEKKYLLSFEWPWSPIKVTDMHTKTELCSCQVWNILYEYVSNWNFYSDINYVFAFQTFTIDLDLCTL